MTPEERLLLSEGGRPLIAVMIATTAPVFLYGLLAPVTILAIYSSIKHQRKTSGSWAPTLVCVFGFVVISVYASLKISNQSFFWDVFTDNTKPLMARLQSYNTKVIEWGIAIGWVETLPPMFNDAFIIWRAWVIFQKQRWTLYLSIFIIHLRLSVCNINSF
ncbi:hypothetical protein DXG01_012224 [Tephrocybe rancida]|nr:hypothetical protein DXG01_012224 [Tephrocybe rancida]